MAEFLLRWLLNLESILKCYECQKTTSYKEAKIVNRGGKKFWVCRHCGFETPFDEKKAPHAKRIKKVTEE